MPAMNVLVARQHTEAAIAEEQLDSNSDNNNDTNYNMPEAAMPGAFVEVN
jgi:hypothetical protein